MKRDLKTSFSSIRRAPFQALGAILSLALTFFVTTFVCILVYSSSKALEFFETRPQIIVFLKPDAKSDAIATLQQKLKQDSRIKDLNFISKEKALEIYKGSTKDNPLLGELVSPQTLPSSLEFSVKSLDDATNVIDSIKNEDIVDSIGFTGSLGGQSTLSDVINRLRRIGFYIRVGGIIFVSVLLMTSLMVLMVVIGMRITTKRNEIETLALLGAKPGFIRSPLMFEAINYGIFGSILGWLLSVLIILYLTPTLINFFGNIPILPQKSIEFFELLALILLGEISVGVIIAMFASSIAISRALSVKK
ncbi:hypothetical protein HYS03_01420 [Candidatus Woesebacteria bacterium]|nr:hypothetical protein [Candidatus Woesebacteria bacterium]QQG47926.1 MAG: hypothetical protein HY044_02465 [Candidatus Woesebacteria bacterium]